MYTIISATNRPENKTYSFAHECKNLLLDKGLEVNLFSLNEIPSSFSFQNMYDFEKNSMEEIVNKFIRPAHKFIFVIPEYNGSFPGILKVLIDAVHPKHWNGKKALLIGTSSGRAGNLRGLDHLTSILHYIKVDVYSQKLPISAIDEMINEDGMINHEETRRLIESHIDQFVGF